MNKLKVLYDLVRTMRSKEAFNGTLTVQVHKDDVQQFSLHNEFAKNLTTGQTKAKINTVWDCDGSSVKHQSTTEFTLSHSGDCPHMGFFRRLHQTHEPCCCALKGKLAKLAFALSVLNALQVEEQEGKTLLLSLQAKDLPEEIRQQLREKLDRAGECQCRHHALFAEFHQADKLDFALGITINAKNEAEKIVVSLVGTKTDASQMPHDTTARAELALAW